MTAWTGFITKQPESPLAGPAFEQVLGIGRLLEGHQAFDAAAGLFADAARFAAGVKVLAEYAQ